VINLYFQNENIFVNIPKLMNASLTKNINDALPLFPLNVKNIVGTPGIVNIFDDSELIIEVNKIDALRELNPSPERYIRHYAALS
jgi:hypothetical protein